eukprot:TRINITY_DN5745_c0_g1_i1.p1 TRINITY_DN5745_c0_g1~~TRINITY_DN5745_c0_g1_i1.p1  ORF type:complete len:178 (+),score=50.79 TRINITY_DN5745_c0_g1_i1:13-546(+)
MANFDFDHVSLDSILSYYPAAYTFRDFLHSIQCSENLAFWLEVEDYRSMSHDPQFAAQRKQRAELIWNMFLSPGSQREVNVDEDVRQEIMNAIESDTLDGSIFDRSQDWVSYMMESDSVPKFIRSETFIEFRERGGELPKLKKRGKLWNVLMKRKNEPKEKSQSIMLLEKRIGGSDE